MAHGHTKPVSWNELLGTFEFVSAGHLSEHQAFLCRESGEFIWHAEYGDELDELPDDIDDDEKYVQIPDKKELDLGKPLVLDFVGEVLPADFDEVRRMFSHKGAYARFKELLDRRSVLDKWYEFEARATEKALRTWCGDNAIAIE